MIESQGMSVSRVLVADDHEAFRQGFVEFLRKHYDVEVIGEAKDGIEAITLTQSLHPDLVLIDMSMPRLSGIEAAQQIRAAFPELKVVFVTIHEEETYQAMVEFIHADGFVRKSFLKEDLKKVLKRVIGLDTKNN